jgi:HEAT repeat protein
VPLIDKLDDKNSYVVRAVIEALVKLDGKQAVEPLLGKLYDEDSEIVRAAINALVKLRDSRAIAPLMEILDEIAPENRVDVSIALHVLGQPQGTKAMHQYLVSDKRIKRSEVVYLYGRYRDKLDQRLLRNSSFADTPWLDPQEMLTELRVAAASEELDEPPAVIRSRYEAMAADLNLNLEWKMN